MRTISNSNLDTQLLTLIFILISIGIVMLYSASSAIANYEFSSDTYFLSTINVDKNIDTPTKCNIPNLIHFSGKVK